MKVGLTTLGCKANQYDTEGIAALFRAEGYEVVPFSGDADVRVINSCSVTQEAVRKSRQLARRAHHANPAAVVVLTGCYAQTGGVSPGSLPGVSLVVGPQDRGRLVELVETYLRDRLARTIVRSPGSEKEFLDLPAGVFPDRTRAWLKIQDGCDRFCAYCQIPMARGPSRSLPMTRVLGEAERLLAAGHRELVLTGIHLGAYGADLPDHPQLAGIVRAIGELPGLFRLRLGSVEPDDVTSELISAIAETPVFGRHLHLPLQSGDDMILDKMRRPYRAEDYAELLGRLHTALPDLAVSTDLLVGFPGETEASFRTTLSFVERMRFSKLHVFPFSSRPGTAAASYAGQLPRSEKLERSRRAIAAGKRTAEEYNRTLIGHQLEVLVEETKGESCRGLCGQYLSVQFKAAGVAINDTAAVVITEATPEILVGHL